MLKESPLGQVTQYIETYSPHLLYPIPRSLARNKTGITEPLIFTGEDIWTPFEISWLNPKGKPVIAMGEFRFPCDSPCIVESKSFKLYLNSFNQSTFESLERVVQTIQADLNKATQSQVGVELFYVEDLKDITLADFEGTCLDHLDLSIDSYKINPNYLKTHPKMIEETVHSHLLKSNCLATGQPDWGSVFIKYAGNQIDHEGLLRYIISFRTHSGFGEHCVEQIFHDITARCRPEKLTVYARYTRRGGLDINPFRSNFEKAPKNKRLYRQ